MWHLKGLNRCVTSSCLGSTVILCFFLQYSSFLQYFQHLGVCLSLRVGLFPAKVYRQWIGQVYT